MKHAWKLLALILGAAAVALIDAAPAPAAGGGIAIVGAGRWESLSGDSIRGDWNVSLKRTKDRLKGTLTMTGSNVFSGGEVDGTIDEKDVTLGVFIEGEKQVTFAGQLQRGAVRGEWTSTEVKDHGVWYGTLVTRDPSLGVENQEGE